MSVFSNFPPPPKEKKARARARDQTHIYSVNDLKYMEKKI